MTHLLPTLNRIKKVHRLHGRFLDACYQNLYIEGWPSEHMPFAQRWLQVFEGVPDVYPHAFALLDAIGPGRGRDVDWLPDDWPPRFRARVEALVFHSRELILEIWGWQPGYSRNDLVELVHERKRTGCPTMQRSIAAARATLQFWLESLTPEQRGEALSDPPPFRETIDPARREQFERIVKLRLDGARPLAINPYPWADPYWISQAFVDSVKWDVFDHLEDLDAHEAQWRNPRSRDPEFSKKFEEEHHLYQEVPLIGRQAAKLHFRTLQRMRSVEGDLVLSILAANKKWKAAQRRECPDQAEPAPAPVTSFEKNEPTPGVGLSPGSKAVAAALELTKKGLPVSLKAACTLAGVDRKNVRRRYPDAYEAIQALSKPDRTLRKATIDRRTGNIDAIDDGEE